MPLNYLQKLSVATICRLERDWFQSSMRDIQRRSSFSIEFFTSMSGLMEDSSRSNDELCRDPSCNPGFTQLRELIASSDYPDTWEKTWKEEVTPWDLGKPTPIVVQLSQAQCLLKARVLVPGCGAGYDVIALAGPDRYVLGLDISSTVIKKASEFLCALDPTIRSAWAKKISEILKPEGELITLIYVVTGQKDGPPFNNDMSDYEEVLHTLGFKQISVEDNELAVEPRKGSEKLVRWKSEKSMKPLIANI